MLDAGGKNEHFAGHEGVPTALGFEHDVSFEQMNGDRSFGVMGRHSATRRECDEGEAKRAILHECSGAPAMTGQEILVDHLLIALEMPDEDGTIDLPIQR